MVFASSTWTTLYNLTHADTLANCLCDCAVPDGGGDGQLRQTCRKHWMVPDEFPVRAHCCIHIFGRMMMLIGPQHHTRGHLGIAAHISLVVRLQLDGQLGIAAVPMEVDEDELGRTIQDLAHDMSVMY